MATDSTIKARVPSKDKELFMKKCEMTGTTASKRIRWLIHHDIENNAENTDTHKITIIKNMVERVGYVRDALLVNLSEGSIEYEKLKQYCRDNDINIRIYDVNDTVLSREGLTTGQE